MPVTLTVLAGSIAMMAYPMFRSDMHPKVEGLVPLTALELAGARRLPARGLRELPHADGPPAAERGGPLQGEPRRRPVPGRYSLAGEFAYDHPFLWGSKRTGPDLAFEGWLKSAAWRYAHFENPHAVVPRSNMPAYAFLKARPVDAEELRGHMRALRSLGVPYTDADLAGADEQSGARRRWTRSSRTCCRSGRRWTAAGRAAPRST